MSPTIRHDTRRVDLDVVRGHRPPTPARIYAWSLLALAIGVVAALIATGHDGPAPGPLLVLAIPLALCMNRYLLFPDELGVTADAAVLFTAMVVFGADAQWTGPLVVALLVGPLDARHWGARAWTRMAYNSGSTALTAAAGLAVDVPLSQHLGAGWDATLGAAAIAAIAYVAVESALGIGLVTLLGERVATAARHQLPLNAIALPLAVVGAAAGLAWLDLGWWVALAVLLPVPLVPELAFVVVPRRWGRPRIAFVVAGALLVVAIALPAGASTATVLVACAVLAGAESRVVRCRVPLLGIALAVATAFVVTGADRWYLIAAVVVVSCAVAWWTTTLPAAGSEWSRVPWCVPELVAAAFVGALAHDCAALGPLVFVAASLVVLILVGAWGAPPWRSRFVGRWADSRVGPRRRAALVAVAVLSVVGAVGSIARADAVLVAGFGAEAALAAAASAVHQWRFAPRRRAREGALVTLVALATAGVVAGFGQEAVGLHAIMICVATVTALVVAWPLDPVRFGSVRSRSASAARSSASSPDG